MQFEQHEPLQQQQMEHTGYTTMTTATASPLEQPGDASMGATTATFAPSITAAVPRLHATQIPCCICGSMIYPNGANQCAACLAQQHNLKGILQCGPAVHGEKIVIHQCRQCRRFARTEKHYEAVEQESPELLAICLKHIPALNGHQASNGSSPRLHLVDAKWIWTEPHSMRFKILVNVRAEIQNVAVEQRVVVVQHVQFQQCPDCNREFTNRTWQAVVQLRQRRQQVTTDHADSSKKGLASLEMALAKNADVRKHVLKMDTTKSGFDFYFLTLVQAQTFTNYLQRVAPMRVKCSQKLVSTNVHNNTANIKHTVTADLVPLCRDDLLLIHKAAKKDKLAGRLALVNKVSSVIHLVDASPKRNHVDARSFLAELSPETYYKQEKFYTVLQTAQRMLRFVVLDVELCQPQKKQQQRSRSDSGDDDGSVSTTMTDDISLYKGPGSGVEKYALADVVVARESDFGVNDTTYTCVTHLGHLIAAGDTVWGYDLTTNSITTSHSADGEWDDALSHHFDMPQVILVKKDNSASTPEVDAAPLPSSSSSTSDAATVDGAEGTRQKKPISKKKQRRQRRQEGKKMRELEESALRMGFIGQEEEEEEEEFEPQETPLSFPDELSRDPDMAAQLQALESALGAIDTVVEEEEEEEDEVVRDVIVEEEMTTSTKASTTDSSPLS